MGATRTGNVDLANFSMRQLQCFVAVARAGSVTRAAEALNTVQPSVSRTIREFEAALGYAVFDRTPGGLELNSTGQMLYRHVSDGMHRIESGLDAIRNRGTGEKVVAFALPNVTRTLMPGAIARFKKLRPEVTVTMPSVGSLNMAELLRRGEVDFGLGRLQSVQRMDGLEFEHLYSEALTWFVRSGHPLASRTSVSIGDIAQFEVSLPIANTIIRQEIDQYLASRGVMQLPNLIETVSFDFSRTYILNNDAIVLMPEGAMERELKAGSVVALPTGRDQLVGSVGITRASSLALSPAAGLLIELIREEVKTRRAGGTRFA